MSTEIEYYWEVFTERGIATSDEINLVTDICGCTIEAMCDILYARTGYRNLEQYFESEGEE
jgi:hypothetical protein